MRVFKKSLFVGLSTLTLLSPLALTASTSAASNTKSTDLVAFEANGNTGTGTYRIDINDNSTWVNSNLVNWTKPQEFELGDLNNDGQSDIVAFEQTGGGQGNFMLGIYRGNRQFTWVASNLHGWANPTSFQVGDVNGDGLADIVDYEPISGSPNTGNFRIGINLGNNKDFAWYQTNLADWQSVTQWRLADMNNDGRADIVAFQTQGAARTSGNYYVGLELGNDQFTHAPKFSWSETLGGFLPPHGIEVGDINGDGRNDFMATEAASGGGVNYMEALATGAAIGGPLSSPSYRWVSSDLRNWTDPYSFQLGNLGGAWSRDGKADIAAAESINANQVDYYMGNSGPSSNYSWGAIVRNYETPLAFRFGSFYDNYQ